MLGGRFPGDEVNQIPVLLFFKDVFWICTST